MNHLTTSHKKLKVGGDRSDEKEKWGAARPQQHHVGWVLMGKSQGRAAGLSVAPWKDQAAPPRGWQEGKPPHNGREGEDVALIPVGFKCCHDKDMSALGFGSILAMVSLTIHLFIFWGTSIL